MSSADACARAADATHRQRALAQLSVIEEVAMLITDATADTDELQRIRDACVEIVVVDG